MSEDRDDVKPANVEAPPIDRGESVACMEPMLVGAGAPSREQLSDLAIELVRKSTAFHASLPLRIRSSLTCIPHPLP